MLFNVFNQLRNNNDVPHNDSVYQLAWSYRNKYLIYFNTYFKNDNNLNNYIVAIIKSVYVVNKFETVYYCKKENIHYVKFSFIKELEHDTIFLSGIINDFEKHFKSNWWFDMKQQYLRIDDNLYEDDAKKICEVINNKLIVTYILDKADI